jgi:hypothetical protein
MLAAALARVDAGGHADGVGVAVDRDVVLVAHVEAFVVLAHHHQVDVLEAAAGNDGLGRTQVGIQLELLAQAHVGGTVAAARRGFQRPLERQPVLADAVDAGLRQRIAAGRDAGQARDLGFPAERRAQRIEHLDRRSGDFGADAVSRDQGGRNQVGAHGCLRDVGM